MMSIISELKLGASLSVLKQAKDFARPIILPILMGIFPALFHYGNNATQLTLSSLLYILAFNLFFVFVFYFVVLLLTRFQAIKAANATFIFLIFFNVYGIIYRRLVNLDIIRVEHYTLLPLMLMLAIYLMLFIIRLQDSASAVIWNYLVFITGIMVGFNIMKIIPAELDKRHAEEHISYSNIQENNFVNKDYPDIYYIVLDEFAGFQAMREYWGYDGVDDFVAFLEDRDFFIAEQSHGSSTDTLHQMASRLNYQEYPTDGPEYIQTNFNNIADNRVMRYLKSRGYTTVVFDETNMAYSSAKSIKADVLYEYGSSSISRGEIGGYEFYFDEFGELVMDNTVLYIISGMYKENSPLVSRHRSMIHFTVDNIANEEVPSPRFVYVHLLLPHSPFAFSQTGKVVDYDCFNNWNCYIDNYKFSINIAEEIINNILTNADPQESPVIIIQSDHGARNEGQNYGKTDGATLLDYPAKYKTLILNAIYLPGYNYSELPQDINPINTFPIIFNYLFDENIELYP